MKIVEEWEPVELEQALSMLGACFSLNKEYSSHCLMNHPLSENHSRFLIKVRDMAIKCLEKTDTERLDLISLQLVQALRYEEIKQSYDMTQSPLKELLFEKAVMDEKLAHSMHWHLELERNNEENGKMTQ